jgi:site-specific DNA recombinase
VVRDLLLRPIYTGHAVSYATRSERRLGGGYVRRVSTAEEQVPLPGIAPAIVSPLEAAIVAQRLSMNKAHPVRNNRSPEAALLRAGFVKCGHCGWAMNVRNPSMSAGNRSASYRCTSRTQRGHDCPQAQIAASLLDDAAWSTVVEVLRDPQIIAREVERHRQDGGLERDRAAVQKKIESFADKQSRIAKRVGDIEDEAVISPLMAELVSLAARKKAAEHELLTIDQRIADCAAEDMKVQTLTAWCQRVGSNLDDLTYSERRLALEALGVQVKVYSNQRAEENGDPIARWTVTLDSMPCLNSSSLLTT